MSKDIGLEIDKKVLKKIFWIKLFHPKEKIIIKIPDNIEGSKYLRLEHGDTTRIWYPDFHEIVLPTRPYTNE